MNTYQEREEQLRILLNQKESLVSRIEDDEIKVQNIKDTIKKLKDEVYEIEDTWRSLQSKYEAASEISRMQGLTKFNKKRSLNSEEIYSIMNRFEYAPEIRKKILSAAGSKSKVNSLNDKISELKYELSQIQPMLDYKKSELPKLQKKIDIFDKPTLF